MDGFARSVRTGAAPLVDVHLAVTSPLVGVLAAESLAQGSYPVPVPPA